MVDRYLLLEWKKSRLMTHQNDNLINTGMWKFVTFEVLLQLVMVYINGFITYYQESGNEYVKENSFTSNDILLAIMLLIRMPFLV